MRAAPARLPSITRRLTMALGGISLVVFLGTSALLDWSLVAEIREQEMAEAHAQLAMIERFIASNPARLRAQRGELDEMLESHPELRVWVGAGDGTPVYGGEPPVARGRRNGLVVLHTPAATFKGLSRRIDAPGPLNGATLTVGLDTAARDKLILEHRTTLILVSLLATLLIIASTAWATTRGLAPIATLSRHASGITPDALGRRLPAEGTTRELHDLALAFNQVLDRLEAAYRHLDEFNANVAHELRTPLATMINGAQVTLASPRGDEELREALASNLEELEDLKRLVNDMLFLAQADRGELRGDLAPVALAAEAHAVVEYFDAAIQEAGVAVHVSGEAHVQGNGPLIRRAIANLVSNALRYSPEGATIGIRVEVEGKTARVSVRNPGPMLDPAALRRIFDRFYRAHLPGARAHEGSGLGLAIVRAIARAHGGDAFASSGAGETEVGFTLRAPGSTPA